jgi:hypothetical protein
MSADMPETSLPLAGNSWKRIALATRLAREFQLTVTWLRETQQARVGEMHTCINRLANINLGNGPEHLSKLGLRDNLSFMQGTVILVNDKIRR